jgi:hypothetical protein
MATRLRQGPLRAGQEEEGVNCPWCGGKGYDVDEMIDGIELRRSCYLCRNTGRVGLWRWLALQLMFGNLRKRKEAP